jgi:hypothetical protein
VTDADLDDLRALQAELEKAHKRRDLPAYYRSTAPSTTA